MKDSTITVGTKYRRMTGGRYVERAYLRLEGQKLADPGSKYLLHVSESGTITLTPKKSVQ